MKKTIKRVMSVFMALALVLSLGMSLGVNGIMVSAAEVEGIADVSAVEPRSITVYQGSNWKFYSRRDSNTGNLQGPGRFYVTAGQTINFVLSGVHSGSSQGFDIYIYRANSAGTPLAEGRFGPYHVSGNLAGGYTLTIEAEYTGYYVVSCQRTNDGYQQIFDSVSIIVC